MTYKPADHKVNNENKLVEIAVNQNLTLAILALDLIEMNEQLKEGKDKNNRKKPKSFWFTIKEYYSNLFAFSSK
jgi:hypothetical protein